MRRREFIGFLGGAAAWPLAARAQPAGKPPTIGWLVASTKPATTQWMAAFAQRLRELGWIDGRNVAVDYRWADGRPERMIEIAAEFVRMHVDIIVTGGTPAVIAAKEATSTIPIVFAAAGDPIGNNLVDSLSRPGGNLTGLSTQHTDTAGKRLAFLREVLPHLRRLAIMTNVGSPDAVLETIEVQMVAHMLGLDVMVIEIRRPQDIAPAIEALHGRVDALFVCTEPLTFTNRVGINALALSERLPTMHGFREHVEAGGLISYGPNMPSLFRRSADLVDKVLRGAKPADIPVEQPTRFDLTVNLITAKSLGLEFPPMLRALATEVIE
jgi:putative tryptophan/tyrosine transport system substrate-binding protein